jgi:pimeloyl-ACP methyl ester carboxylesterase
MRFAVVLGTAFLITTGSASALKVSWMPGAKSPGTPAKYDKVGVLKVGPRSARNVLVLEPGTSAGSTYFVPLAKWIVAKTKGWQVWSVERRENLLEDQSELNLAKQHKASYTQLFDYYLGYLTDPSITHHFNAVDPATVGFAKQWGMKVAVGDLHRVIAAARKLGGTVVLGGHSLGGAVVTAYATWNFHGHAGADGLGGLVYIDGGSFGTETAAQATTALQQLQAGSPWLAFGGIGAPLAGLLEATGATSALIAPNAPFPKAATQLLGGVKFPDGRSLVPPVPVTNLAQYGYALNVPTSPGVLAAAQAHLGKGIAAAGPVHGWDGAGALTPIKRFATMFSGLGINNADGTEWYFPQRLTDDSGAVGNGLANPAQKVLGLDATMGRKLPRTLRIYAFGAALGGPLVLSDARGLARQSRIPMRNLVLINRHSTYAHNDPGGAYPHNVFFAHLVPFLQKVAASG